ncbi:hypothetical protein HWV62_20820 [Athelia sp. TMB]|nr:hypothetical protein HWV62_20820 [Athelia sp. TMB]
MHTIQPVIVYNTTVYLFTKTEQSHLSKPYHAQKNAAQTKTVAPAKASPPATKPVTTTATKAPAPAHKSSEKRARSPVEIEEAPKRIKTSAITEPATKAIPTKDIVQAPPAGEEPVQPPKFTGNFDLYDMRLPFLQKPYLSEGSSKPNHEAVYKTILTYQAKNDRSARCYLSASILDNSRFECAGMLEPFSEEPFDIVINSLEPCATLSFSEDELDLFISQHTRPDAPGVSGEMELEEDSCGIDDASGVFKLERVWTMSGDGGELLELYEGVASFHVSYSGLYRRKGHGPGQDVEFAMWGVRARVVDGKEVGLRPIAPVPLGL